MFHVYEQCVNSHLCAPLAEFEHASVDSLQDLYDSTLSTLLNKHAPRRVVRRLHQSTTPWFDSDCAAVKRKARMYERRYRRTHAAADRHAWIAEVRRKQRLYSQKQNYVLGSQDRRQSWQAAEAVVKPVIGAAP